MSGKILIVGFGPGSFSHITQRAREAIGESQVIIGYNTYVDLIRGLLTDQELIRTGMTEEVSRAQKAVELASEGAVVAVISSGDAGVYGMAGLVYEVLVARGWKTGDEPQVEVIPGVSAVHSCAALLGAPIMHDACTISLSDHLTPWQVIERRIEAAAAADFVIALYNPRSGRRTRQIVETQRIVSLYRTADTPVGLVKSAYRDREQVVRTTLADMLHHEIGMLTTVIIGNSSTFYHGDLMITPRGYQRKYTLTETDQPLRPGERLRKEHEPWGLAAKADASNADMPARSWAEQAVARLVAKAVSEEPAAVTRTGTHVRASVLEIAVSSGVANKKFTANQLLLLADLAGEQGELEYTTAHQLILRTHTDDPQSCADTLREAGLQVWPVGEVIKVKACDFCDGEKAEGIPYAERIANTLSGLTVEKELRIGFNGCAMACYGAVGEDIGLVFRKGKFDLFLGGKTTGRNAGPGQRVAEGLPAEQVPALLERIVSAYRSLAFPGERFHKFFARVGEVEGFAHKDHAPVVVADAVCGS